jgi:hypothetical protein
MSQLTKSLEKRIQELTASIDAQKIELAAYQRVLHLETSKGSASSEPESIAEEAASAASTSHAPAETEPESSAELADVHYKGNKTTMVADIVKTYGSAGATPKDVDAFFTAKNIYRSKNLVYNTLSYLVARKKLIRREGKYFATGIAPVPAKKRGPKKGSKRTVAAVPTPTKRRLSPEGLKRIKEALKKRWADKRAAEAAAATKTAAKKKA